MRLSASVAKVIDHAVLGDDSSAKRSHSTWWWLQKRYRQSQGLAGVMPTPTKNREKIKYPY
ncbi:hypothetical protein BDA96_04G111100 [Sorghum bicolor]|uniref:Uncharacterized protein n=2 Tax=Sorghum bicolor TaxID=4558 RepID=A0A921R5E6_SORBI|nr:hypothetical protein BDA96_04G111100 [Sorghum bicolor]OQU84684.1 hypothetical protein SORBI_3004G102950 [Sorghum bicolor]